MPGGLPGDQGPFAEVTKITPRFGVTRIIEQRSPSPDRIKAPCPVFTQCGGCKLQDLKYEQANGISRLALSKMPLKHIGKNRLTFNRINSRRKNIYHYRNKGSFAVQKQAGFLRIGFFKKGSHDVVSTEKCAEFLPCANQQGKGIGFESY